MHEQRKKLIHFNVSDAQTTERVKTNSHTSNVFDAQTTEELKKFSHTSDVSDAKLGNELKKYSPCREKYLC